MPGISWKLGKISDIEGRVEQDEKVIYDAPEKDGWLCIPIRLVARVERYRVIDDAVRQVRSIAERLLKAFPGGYPDTDSRGG